MTAEGRGCVKTQDWIDFRGVLTIRGAKRIEYRAFYEIVFNWKYHDLAFSHNLGRLPTINIVWFCIAYHKWIVQYSSSTSIPESGFLRFRSKSLLCSPTNRRRIVNSVILSLAIARLGSEPAATTFALPSSFLNDLIG